MITHGKKQISEIVYARKSSDGGGAVRLTNIIRGAQVVFGDLKPSPSSWGLLDAPTVAAILAAFGAEEGTQVIRKTNDYLNAIDATDQQRAQQLAMFINEDPMLVCSLVETSKERWLVGDGKAYIDTGYSYKAEDIFIRFRSNGENSDNWLGGVIEQQNGVNVGFGFNYWGISVGNPYKNYGDVGSAYRNASHKAPSKVTLARSGIKFEYDGIIVFQAECTSLSTDFETKLSFYLLSQNNISFTKNAGNMDLRDAIFIKNGIESHHFIPCKSQNRNGVLDLITLEWKGNSAGTGQFTIEITDK